MGDTIQPTTWKTCKNQNYFKKKKTFIGRLYFFVHSVCTHNSPGIFELHRTEESSGRVEREEGFEEEQLEEKKKEEAGKWKKNEEEQWAG